MNTLNCSSGGLIAMRNSLHTLGMYPVMTIAVRGGVYSYFSTRRTEVIVTAATCLPASIKSGSYGFSSGAMRYGADVVGVGSWVGVGRQADTNIGSII